ncbi:MAG: NAD(P)H-dependent oxidoreductase [Verrucomicrobiota bacterium]
MSENVKLVAFAGSARRDSWNKKLVNVAAEGAREAGAEVTVVDLKDYPMPVFDQDDQAENGMDPNAEKLQQILIEHDGFMIASPEYNSSVTPLLLNTIDWTTRSGHDGSEMGGYNGKTAVLMSASPGGLGGLRGLVHLRSILGNIGVHVLPDQRAVGSAFKAFDEEGNMTDSDQENAIKKLGARLAEVTAKLKE